VTIVSRNGVVSTYLGPWLYYVVRHDGIA